jgi:hypothetical protein
VVVTVALVVSYILGLGIVVRGFQLGHLRHYGFFYSFFIYYMGTALAGWVFFAWIPAYYPHFFWIRFLTLVGAEFALLVQIGDRVFWSYPALRFLGRLITLGTTLVFSVFFIFPPLFEARSSKIAVYDLVKRSALTKAVIILVLVALARRFHVALGRNIGGIALGLMVYLGINTANFALVERLGWESYGDVFRTVGPLTQTLMTAIWAVALWNFDRVPSPSPMIAGEAGTPEEPLEGRMMRYNDSLQRLLRK